MLVLILISFNAMPKSHGLSSHEPILAHFRQSEQEAEEQDIR